jgi:recombination protein RecA
MVKKTNEALDRLKDALSECKAQLGKDVVRTYEQQVDCEVVPTDFYELNKATNLGGIPLGKMIEIFGPESSGKSTLAWQILSTLSKATGKKILCLDYEMSVSKPYLKLLGVPVEEVIFVYPDGNLLEDGFDAMKKLLPTGAFCGAIVDSVAMMVPKAESESIEEKGLAGNDMMLKAKVLTKALRNYGPIFRNSGATVIFINHIMSKVQQGPFAPQGDPEETPGGHAFKHNCDMRLSLKPMNYVTKQVASEVDPKKKINVKIGRDIKAKFVKNRVGEPFGETVMTLRNGKGFDVITSAIKRAISEGIILRESGGEHKMKDDPAIKASSYNNFWTLFAVNPKLTQMLLSKLKGKAVKYDASDFDLTVNERGVKASELGVSDEDVIDAQSGLPRVLEEPDI